MPTNASGRRALPRRRGLIAIPAVVAEVRTGDLPSTALNLDVRCREKYSGIDRDAKSLPQPSMYDFADFTKTAGLFTIWFPLEMVMQRSIGRRRFLTGAGAVAVLGALDGCRLAPSSSRANARSTLQLSPLRAS